MIFRSAQTQFYPRNLQARVYKQYESMVRFCDNGSSAKGSVTDSRLLNELGGSIVSLSNKHPQI